MREIKFRAWHKEAGEYCEGNTSNMFRWIEDEQPVVLEQFTGLTDVNGVEIYEGDIVIWGGDVAETVFYDCDMASFVTETSCIDSCMKVIGNIHQNPELLS